VGTPASATGYKLSHRLPNGTWQSESFSGVTSGQQLFGVGGTGSTAIVLGYPGVIARRNGGGTWDQELYDVPAAADLSKLWARGANDMFVGGETLGAGEIGYYDGTWWRLHTGIQYAVSGIHGIGDDVLAVSGDKVFKHANVSWSQPIPSSGQSIVAVSTTAADKTYVLSRDRLQVKTSGRFEGGVGPDAVAGAPQFSNSIIASSMWASGNSIAITSNENTGRGLPISSRVYRFNGTSWTTDTFPDAANGSDLTAIAGSSTLLFVGGADGAIRRFNGSWAVEAAAATNHYVSAIWSDPSGIAYAVGAAPGGVTGPAGEVRRRDATGTWTAMTLPPGTQSLESVWGSSANDVWAVGGVGPNNIYHYDGTSWTRFVAPTPYDLKGVAGTGPNDVFAVGSSNVIHWDGISWTQLKIPQSLDGSYEHVSARAGLVLISGRVLFALVRTGPW